MKTQINISLKEFARSTQNYLVQEATFDIRPEVADEMLFKPGFIRPCCLTPKALKHPVLISVKHNGIVDDSSRRDVARSGPWSGLGRPRSRHRRFRKENGILFGKKGPRIETQTLVLLPLHCVSHEFNLILVDVRLREQPSCPLRREKVPEPLMREADVIHHGSLRHGGVLTELAVQHPVDRVLAQTPHVRLLNLLPEVTQEMRSRGGYELATLETAVGLLLGGDAIWFGGLCQDFCGRGNPKRLHGPDSQGWNLKGVFWLSSTLPYCGVFAFLVSNLLVFI